MINLTPHLWQTENVDQLTDALVLFHSDFQDAKLAKDAKNNHLNNSYVTLDNLLNVVRPLLSKHGLVVSQDLAGDSLTTVIYHKSGQFKGSAMPFKPMSGNKGTNELQQLGGGITYAKRYALSAALAISVDTDDDGNSAPITKQDLTPKKEAPKTTPKPLQKKKIETPEQERTLMIWVNEKSEERVQQALDNYELTDDQRKAIESLR